MREDWIECVVDDVVELMKNGSSAKQFNEKVGFPITRIETIWNEQIDLQRVKYIKENGEEIIEKHGLKLGDILLSHINSDSHLGKTAIFKNQTKILIHGINLLLLRPHNQLNQDFINYQFKFLRAKGKFIEAAQRAVNQSSINQQKLKQLEIKLAPLPIQRAIVSKIEALFSDLDNGIANFKKAQEQLKIYRQAVLKKAFEGELTKEWREKQSNLPTAEELLKQIKEERQNHYNQQIENWKKAVKEWEKNGKIEKKPSKPRKINELPPLKEDELEELIDLPTGWRWERFGNVCLRIMDGTHFSPKNSESGDYMYITAKNIKEGRIDLTNISYVSYDDHKVIYERCDVKKGDVLYIKDGATTGKAAVNNINEEFSLLSSVGVFRVSENVVLSKYLEYFLNAEVNRNRMLSNVAGVAITRLTLVKLNYSLFSICSLQEQTQIVAEIESRLSVCDKVEQSITESLEKAEALRQSILKKAFEGKLLTEAEIEQCKAEADYEPATKLLERIKQEKMEKNKNKKTKKK